MFTTFISNTRTHKHCMKFFPASQTTICAVFLQRQPHFRGLQFFKGKLSLGKGEVRVDMPRAFSAAALGTMRTLAPSVCSSKERWLGRVPGSRVLVSIALWLSTTCQLSRVSAPSQATSSEVAAPQAVPSVKLNAVESHMGVWLAVSLLSVLSSPALGRAAFPYFCLEESPQAT